MHRQGSIQLIAGATAGIDPVFSKIERTEKTNGVFVSGGAKFERRNFLVVQRSSQDRSALGCTCSCCRQKWIDQSQSLNLFVTSDAKAKDLLSYYVTAWNEGCKSVYYMRSKAVEVEECEVCQ